MVTITRRKLLAALASAAAWPFAAHAQQGAMPVVGYLFRGSGEPSANIVTAFRRGLSKSGYVEGLSL
jgi:putative ABC transport system substrate-binding protein